MLTLPLGFLETPDFLPWGLFFLSVHFRNFATGHQTLNFFYHWKVAVFREWGGRTAVWPILLCFSLGLANFPEAWPYKTLTELLLCGIPKQQDRLHESAARVILEPSLSHSILLQGKPETSDMPEGRYTTSTGLCFLICKMEPQILLG